MLKRLKHWLLSKMPAESDAATPEVAAPPAQRPASSGSADIVVIDVRSEREFQATAIEHAINVPLPQLAQRISELVTDKSTPLVLYCASGARSGSACKVLEQLGYANVSNAGGLYAAATYLQRDVRR